MNKDELSAKLLRAVGHPLRLRIIKILHESPSCVNDLHRTLKCSPPNLSQHLRILSEVGILESKKTGFPIIYKTKKI